MRKFIIVGMVRQLIGEVLLAAHALARTDCAVISGSPASRILRYSRLCSSFVELDFHGADDGRLVAVINALARGGDEYIVLAVDPPATRMLNRVRTQLAARIVAAPATAVLDRFDDKWQFYRLCLAQRLRVPESYWFATKQALEFRPLAHALGLPFVVRPLSEAASSGVYAIASQAELEQKIQHNPAYRHAPLIVSRFITGTDVGLNLACTGGRLSALAIQQRVVQKRVGSKIKFLANDYLLTAAQALAAHSGYDGVMNIDARIARGSGEVYLFEANPRFWRTLSASLWCGMNFVAEAIEPGDASRGPRMLSSGCADTYFHPLFRPAQLHHALFDRGPRGRLVRLKLRDPYTLAASAVTLMRACMAHDSQVMALCDS